jgi:putative transposase
MGIGRNFSGENFWARGYFVSTVGLDEEEGKKYIREQEKEDERLDQLKFDFEDQSPSGDS